MAEQLSRINEQLAIKNRRAKRVWKVFAFTIGGIIVMYILGVIIAFTGCSLLIQPGPEIPKKLHKSLLERKQILKNLNRLCSNHLPKNAKNIPHYASWKRTVWDVISYYAAFVKYALPAAKFTRSTSYPAL